MECAEGFTDRLRCCDVGYDVDGVLEAFPVSLANAEPGQGDVPIDNCNE